MKLEKPVNLAEINGNEILEFLNNQIKNNEDLCDVSLEGPLEFENQKITENGYVLEFSAYYNNWGTHQLIPGMEILITDDRAVLILDEPFDGDGSDEALEEVLVEWLATHKFLPKNVTDVKFEGMIASCREQLLQISVVDTEKLEKIIDELKEARSLMKK
jgi:hypothetical protein